MKNKYNAEDQGTVAIHTNLNQGSMTSLPWAKLPKSMHNMQQLIHLKPPISSNCGVEMSVADLHIFSNRRDKIR